MTHQLQNQILRFLTKCHRPFSVTNIQAKHIHEAVLSHTSPGCRSTTRAKRQSKPSTPVYKNRLIYAAKPSTQAYKSRAVQPSTPVYKKHLSAKPSTPIHKNHTVFSARTNSTYKNHAFYAAKPSTLIYKNYTAKPNTVYSKPDTPISKTPLILSAKTSPATYKYRSVNLLCGNPAICLKDSFHCPYIQHNNYNTHTFNEAGRALVRKKYKCDEKVKEKECLAFRQTTKEECHRCYDPIRVPCKCPPLKRLKAQYDPSELKWQHSCPPSEWCNIDPPRMDQVKGVRVTPKQLPPLPDVDDCVKCKAAPTRGPPLRRLKPRYDVTKMKWKHVCPPPDLCNIDPPRMDNLKGVKVTPKCLPKLPDVDDCVPCKVAPKQGPHLPRLKPQYDPMKLKWKHVCPPPDLCDIDPPRMDDVLCWTPTRKKLPSF